MLSMILCDSNKYSQYTISHYEKENHPKLSQMCRYGIFSKEPKNELETAVVRAISVIATEVRRYLKSV